MFYYKYAGMAIPNNDTMININYNDMTYFASLSERKDMTEIREEEFLEIQNGLPRSLPIIEPVSLEESTQATMYVTAILDTLMAQGSFPEQPAEEFASISSMSIEQPSGKGGIIQTTAGIPHSPRYDFWRFAYFRNHTNTFTLDRLVNGGVLRRDEADQIIAERLEEFGM